VDDLAEAGIEGVAGEQTSGVGVGADQADLGVDVQSAVLAARRPNDGGAVSLIVEDVVLIVRANPLGFGDGLFVALANERFI
jgi:hypothetical protein